MGVAWNPYIRYGLCVIVAFCLVYSCLEARLCALLAQLRRSADFKCAIGFQKLMSISELIGPHLKNNMWAVIIKLNYSYEG